MNRVIPADLIDSNTKIYVNPTGRLVVGGPHLVGGQLFEVLRLAVQRPDVRPEELVRRADEYVDAERGELRFAPGGEVSGVVAALAALLFWKPRSVLAALLVEA